MTDFGHLFLALNSNWLDENAKNKQNENGNNKNKQINYKLVQCKNIGNETVVLVLFDEHRNVSKPLKNDN